MRSYGPRGFSSLHFFRTRRYDFDMSGERILIVDDERAIAELIRDYLERDGFRTSMAFDGAQALSVFKVFKPDLVLLDIMLPSVDGQELCRMLRSGSDVPIVMLSA